MTVKRAGLLVRHQVAAGIGTSADFGTMIALVELARLSPPAATILSAMVGGLVNFGVSRLWAFRDRHQGTWSAQGIRYALASLGGALLNALVLGGVLRVIAIPYPFARALVAVLVSLLYTYPVHTRLVFQVAEPGSPGAVEPLTAAPLTEEAAAARRS